MITVPIEILVHVCWFPVHVVIEVLSGPGEIEVSKKGKVPSLLINELGSSIVN